MKISTTLNYFDDVFIFFLDKDSILYTFSKERQKTLGLNLKYLKTVLSYGLGTTWGCHYNDIIFIFGWTLINKTVIFYKSVQKKVFVWFSFFLIIWSILLSIHPSIHPSITTEPVSESSSRLNTVFFRIYAISKSGECNCTKYPCKIDILQLLCWRKKEVNIEYSNSYV